MRISDWSSDVCSSDLTARDLFYRRGIRAVGVEEIVNRAGVTKPSLYRAFASKDDLVAACLQASAMEKRAELDEVIAAASPDPLEQLRAVLQIGRAHVELQSLMRISYAVFCLKQKK